jgi:hypothetical protein
VNVPPGRSPKCGCGDPKEERSTVLLLNRVGQLEHGETVTMPPEWVVLKGQGKKSYFIVEETRREFANQNKIPKK